jgi:predicted nucleotidyltransferase component of viral defense system
MSPLQVKVLGILFESGLGERSYYLTGGTALAEFYLQHRCSDDLDLFTRSRRSIKTDYRDLKRVLEQQGLEFSSVTEDDEFVRLSISTSVGGGESVKVEFAWDAGSQMSPALTDGRVVVDSFEDIAVNKVCAIYGRVEVKDFVDLFFILNESKFPLDHLVGRAKEKEAAFDREDAVLEFATKLLAVENLQLHQIRMIKPLSLD